MEMTSWGQEPDVSYSRTTAVTKRPCVNLIKGVERVGALCRILKVNSQIEELSKSYFREAYQNPSFIRSGLPKKDVLAGSCVLLGCRMLSWPVTMATVGFLVDADPLTVGSVYQEVVKSLKIEAPLFNVTDVMEAHSREYQISSPDVPKELAENPAELTKRAVALVELSTDSWIVTGRRPAPIMMAATYLAWQSLNPNRQRLRLTLGKFCQVAKVTKQKAALQRIVEMKEMLCKLGKEIPWLRETVTPDNVVVQLGDILENRYALLRRAGRTHEASLREKESQSEEAASPTTSEAEDQRWENPERSEQQGDPAPNEGKRALFAPPCVTNGKKRRVEQPRFEDVTGDEEISDSEIDSYIRTPQEARDFAATQQMFSSADGAKL
ncbi:transcription factor IIIB 50 kDa subunit isoform 2-T2 [Pholidichthys leucotaenia]